jgi:hypothetical protein
MRILVILLVIGILLFVVLMVWGARMNASQKPSAGDFFGTKSHPTPHPYLDAFQGILRPFSPTLKASFLRPAITTFDLASKSPYTITVLRDDKHKFRQAKFVVQPIQTILCAHVTYWPLASKDMDKDLKKPQDSNDIEKKDPLNEFKLTIVDGGGTLVVERYPPLSPPRPCSVELK